MVMKTLLIFFIKILFYDSHKFLVQRINILINKFKKKQINFK
jgi:hypothetical protein